VIASVVILSLRTITLETAPPGEDSDTSFEGGEEGKPVEELADREEGEDGGFPGWAAPLADIPLLGY